MFRVSATTNAADLERRLNNAFARQVPFATALALTRTAQKIREAEKAEMQSAFDRPTPFTLNAFQVVPANKETLAAEVRYKDTPLWTRKHFLEVQEAGGLRGQKGMEKRLMFGLPVPFPVWGIVPVFRGRFGGAQADRYGNWATSERNRVLSQLQVQGDAFANSTPRSLRRQSNRYFVPKHGLPPGIYKRGPNSDIPILIARIIDGPPRYTPRFDFYGTASRTFAAVYDAEFEVAIQRALDTAR